MQGAALSTLATEFVVSIGCLVALARLRGTLAAAVQPWTRDREARRDSP